MIQPRLGIYGEHFELLSPPSMLRPLRCELLLLRLRCILSQTDDMTVLAATISEHRGVMVAQSASLLGANQIVAKPLLVLVLHWGIVERDVVL